MSDVVIAGHCRSGDLELEVVLEEKFIVVRGTSTHGNKFRVDVARGNGEGCRLAVAKKYIFGKIAHDEDYPQTYPREVKPDDVPRPDLGEDA